ncbi:unnamed protein product [Tuber aestivum]|uniref:Coenzyme Q biosynthesis protein 4 n=1 Tax=Tuber aestivum TaxID=59557 RepID=A0A292Q8R9_9PEZI|nr:unnamed protein product [Tuber aestivum]
MSLLNARRGVDLIAALVEATVTPYLIHRLRDAMLSSSTGRRILKDRARINSTTVSLEWLRNLPDVTMGREYAAYLDRESVSLDTASLRYRECHNFYHALTGLPVIAEGEVVLKACEFANTLLPRTGLSMFVVVGLGPGEGGRVLTRCFPCAIRNGLQAKEVISIYWEEELETDVKQLRKRIGWQKPPE